MFVELLDFIDMKRKKKKNRIAYVCSYLFHQFKLNSLFTAH